jgi:hypothetical protein
MAKYNEILAARFNKALTKIFGMKGEAPAPQLASEINAALPMFYGREMRNLEGWQSAMGHGAIAAVAANNGKIRLRNPAGSNVIIVIERMTAQTVAAGGTQLNFNLPPDVGDFATFGTWVNTDSRSGATAANGNAALQGRISSATAATTGGPDVYQVPTVVAGALAFADYIISDVQEIVLLPGCSVDLVNQTQNANFDASFMWRERVMEESERQ